MAGNRKENNETMFEKRNVAIYSDWSSVQYSSNLARASGVARRLATQQIGGVSGRPCSLAEMAIPALGAPKIQLKLK